MKKIMPALIVITVLVCTLTSCFLFESFELMYDESEISKIQIVKLLEYDESKGEYNIEIISTVKNNSSVQLRNWPTNKSRRKISQGHWQATSSYEMDIF